MPCLSLMDVFQINMLRSRSLHAIAILVSMIFGLASVNIAFAGTPNLLSSKSKKKKQEVVDAIPLKNLTAEYQVKLQKIIDKPSLFRNMPDKEIECDPEMYLFLIRHPEVIVNMWDIMGITKVQVQRTGKFTFDTADGGGTKSKVELIYGTPNLHLFYAEGAYDGPLIKKKVNGRCLMVLRSEYEQRDDRDFITSRLDVFVQLDHLGIEVLLKALHPLIGKTADYNFVESTGFLGRVSQAAEQNAPGIERLAERLTKVNPEVRAKFTRLAHSVNQKAALKVDVDNAPRVPTEKDFSSNDSRETRSAANQPLDFSKVTKNAQLSPSTTTR